VAGSKAFGVRKGISSRLKVRRLTIYFLVFSTKKVKALTFYSSIDCLIKPGQEWPLQNEEKPMTIGFLGAGPKMPGLGGGFDAAQLTSLALKATMQRQAPAAGVAARADRAPAVVVAIDPRAAERSVEIARLAEQAEGAASAPDWGGRTMAEPNWDKKMIAEMIDIAKRQVWAISEALRVYDETGEAVAFSLDGARFESHNNWEVFGGPEKYIDFQRKGLEISKAGLQDLETRVTPTL
jgi:hypothetical protein